LAELTEMRQGIEPAASTLAARNTNETDPEAIRKGLRCMKAAAQGEDDSLSADIAFHIAILIATKNPFYRETSELVNTGLRFSVRFTHRTKGHTETISSNKEVARVIVARDANQASDAMRLIMADVLELIRAASPHPPSRHPSIFPTPNPNTLGSTHPWSQI
jgi:DNA-binding FadR family transcriptional regulator